MTNLAAARLILAGGLTPRRVEILRLLAEGDSYAEIGEKLFLAPETVRNITRATKTALGARTRTHAVAIAIRAGLLAEQADDPPDDRSARRPW